MIPDEIKQMFSSSMGKAIILILMAFLSIILVYVFHFSKDNVIEQLTEQAIEETTGLKIDLTPDGKE